MAKCKEAGIEPTYYNRMNVGEKFGLLNPEDPLALLRASYEDLRRNHPFPTLVLIDSVRSQMEVQFLRSMECDLRVIALVLGRESRHVRLAKRDGHSREELEHRDGFELGHSAEYSRHFEVSNVLALADAYILGQGDTQTPASFHEHIDCVMETMTRKAKCR